MKNALPLFIGMIGATAAIESSAALPPKYLGIPDFAQCLATREVDTYRAWCLPAVKPEPCPAASWGQLNALAGADKLPDCPAEAKPAAPSPVEKPSEK